MVVSPPMNDESDVIFRDMLLWHSQINPEVRPKASDWLLGDAHGNESPQSELDISRWPLSISVDDRSFFVEVLMNFSTMKTCLTVHGTWNWYELVSCTVRQVSTRY